VPRKIQVQLEAIAFRIAHVDRYGVAVSGWLNVLRAVFDHAAVHFAQGGKAVGLERELVDDIEVDVLRATGREYDLVVFIRIAAHEHQVDGTVGALQFTAIGNGALEQTRVEIFHPRDVGSIDADMAEGKSGT